MRMTKAVWCGILLVGMVPGVWADGPPSGSPAPAKDDRTSLLKRIDQLEQQLKELQKSIERLTPPAVDAAGVKLVLEQVALVPEQYGELTTPRMCVLRVGVLNSGKSARSFGLNDFRLLVDGEARQPEVVPDRLRNHSFPWGVDYLYLSRLNFAKQLHVAAEGTNSAWLFFPNLPAGTRVPRLELRLKQGSGEWTLDLNRMAAERLDLKSELLGPRNALAVLTIDGELNSVSVGRLMEEFDALSEKKITRVVLAWGESAVPVEPQLANWLRMSAEQEDRTVTSQLPFPTIPARLKSLYLAGLPTPYELASQGQKDKKSLRHRIHTRIEDAVKVAMEPLLSRIPRDELVQQMSEGPAMVRGAAIAVGAARLTSDELPRVLEGVRDRDPLIQRAAVQGLQHFGEVSAIDQLEHIVRRRDPVLSSIAIESLAASRFELAHERLLKLLSNEPLEQRILMFQTVLKFPRAFLAEPLFRFVSEHPQGMRPVFLQAFETVGHPQLTKILETALTHENDEVSKESLRILVDRNQAATDELALKYTLERLQTQNPTPVMLRLLNRTKDPRAVPLLLNRLQASAEGGPLVETLGRIADPEIAPKLVEAYPQLMSTQQGELLKILRIWQRPEFRPLAHEALSSADVGLVQRAALELMEGPGDRGLPWIAEAIQGSRRVEVVQQLCTVLGNLGTPEARGILQKTRAMNSEGHRQAAMTALAGIRSRSPGFSYVLQAQESQQSQNWKQAIEEYSQAIKLDGELYEAFLGRADCFVRTNRLKESGPDFSRALELEPYSSSAFTGVCLHLAIAGKIDESVQKLEEGRQRFPRDPNFCYNSACTYGRCVEFLQTSPESAKHAARIQQLTRMALQDLRRAVELGFRDANWMKKDPDLKTFQELPEFLKLLKELPAQSPAPPAVG